MTNENVKNSLSTTMDLLERYEQTCRNGSKGTKCIQSSITDGNRESETSLKYSFDRECLPFALFVYVILKKVLTKKRSNKLAIEFYNKLYKDQRNWESI